MSGTYLESGKLAEEGIGILQRVRGGSHERGGPDEIVEVVLAFFGGRVKCFEHQVGGVGAPHVVILLVDEGGGGQLGHFDGTLAAALLLERGEFGLEVLARVDVAALGDALQRTHQLEPRAQVVDGGVGGGDHLIEAKRRAIHARVDGLGREFQEDLRVAVHLVGMADELAAVLVDEIEQRLLVSRGDGGVHQLLEGGDDGVVRGGEVAPVLDGDLEVFVAFGDAAHPVVADGHGDVEGAWRIFVAVLVPLVEEFLEQLEGFLVLFRAHRGFRLAQQRHFVEAVSRGLAIDVGEVPVADFKGLHRIRHTCPVSPRRGPCGSRCRRTSVHRSAVGLLAP